jgi:polysaccharide biosynthesis/export protein
VCGSLFAQKQGNQPPTGTQVSPTTPSPITPEPPKVNPSGPADSAGAVAGVDPKTFLIGPGDVLYIDIWREPTYSRPTYVRPDGKITMPIINDLQAEGLTPDRLASQIGQAYADLIVNPIVTVTVTAVNSKKYTITGEINRPGQYPLVGPVRVFEALNNAGGFRDFANKKDIRINRDNGKQILKFNWSDVANGKRLDQNVLLQNGDTIIVK